MSAPSMQTDVRPDQEQGFANLVEEITRKMQRGERVDIDAYVRRHPEYTGQLRDLLPTIRVLADLGASASEGKVDATPLAGGALAGTGTLGDFRMVREIGRGGMGIVYEAEQISLGRRVALKVLPFAGMLDSRQLQRFQNEARTAASLKHPNIVGVHAVGCERAVYFYAMEYVEGKSLAQVIHELRGAPAARDAGENPLALREKAAAKTPADEQVPISMTRDPQAGTPGTPESVGMKAPSDSPSAASASSPGPSAEEIGAVAPPSGPAADTKGQLQAATSTNPSARNREFFRSAARLGVQAAEALEHAHQMGVVHRDIKPSNLLVEFRLPSSSGSGIEGEDPHLWVTDFGLAMIQGDPALTMTGDILGTLRYMSPEQALGNRREMDHRTDIYSLGVTLYELLTLQPAFGGDDRKRLIRQLVEEDPPPPRSVNPAIPLDLETIVLKAMAKESSQRYAVAQEFADDLKHFLADEPIRARRPSLADRAAKWARRHRPLVWSAAVFLVLSTIGLAISTLSISSAYREKNQQLIATQNAEQLAKEQAEKAKNNFKMARDAVKKYYTQVADDPRLKPHNFEKLRRDLLELANEYYGKLISQEADNPDLQHERVGAFLARGNIETAIGNSSEAEAAYNQALAAATRLTQVDGTEAEYQNDLAASHSGLGTVYRGTGRAQEAEAAYKEALAIGRILVEKHPEVPEYQSRLAVSYYNLGDLYRDLGRAQGAEAAYKEAIAIGRILTEKHPEAPEYQSALATSHHNLGALYVDLGRAQEAEAARKEAIASRRILAEKYFEVPAYQHGLAASHSGLGTVYRSAGRAQEAEAAYTEAITIEKILVERHPEVPEYQHTLAGIHSTLGILYAHTDRTTQAEAAYKEALTIVKIVAEKHPEVPEYQKRLAIIYQNLAIVYGHAGRTKEEEAAFKEALAILKTLVEKHPEVPKYQNVLANCHCNLGVLYGGAGRAKEAEAAYTEAITIDKILVERHPEVPEYQDILARSYHNLGDVHRGLGRANEAIADYNQALAINPKHDLAYFNRGQAWKDKGEYDKAIADYNEAIRLNPNSANPYNGFAWLHATSHDEKYRDGKKAVENASKAYQLDGGKNFNSVEALAAAYAESGDFEKAKHWGAKAIQLAATDKSATDKVKAVMASRLELYKQGKPCCERPKK